MRIDGQSVAALPAIRPPCRPLPRRLGRGTGSPPPGTRLASWPFPVPGARASARVLLRIGPGR
jgi:hypothetical protein